MATPEEIRERYQQRASHLRGELVEKMSALATAAFGLVAALAWNNAIQAIFRRWYPAPNDPAAIGPLLYYALLVTLTAVVVMLWIGSVSARLKREARKT